MGTALAMLFSRVAGDVWLWSRDPGHAAELVRTRANERHLPGIELPEAIRRVKRTDPTDTKSDRDKRVHGQMISAAIRVYKIVGDKTEYDK